MPPVKVCRFTHTDINRPPHKCDPTCRLSLGDAATWMNINQDTFTFQYRASRERFVRTRTLEFKLVDHFLSRRLRD